MAEQNDHYTVSVAVFHKGTLVGHTEMCSCEAKELTRDGLPKQGYVTVLPVSIELH